jgi:protein-serine/threonine kinase
MAYSAVVYPMSPSSPDFNQIGNLPDTPRRSKRESTTSITRQREQAADRYPSPPPTMGMSSSQSTGGISGESRRSGRPQSIESSLQIPPYNPSRRNQVASSFSSDTASTTTLFPSAPPSTRSSTATSNEDQLSSLPPLSPPASSSRSHQSRPSSAMVTPTPLYNSQIPTGAASRSRQSVSVLPSQSQQNISLSSAGPYPTLYQPHPMPRQKIYFGPYILLQTLGEGEFGKVKLGIHSEKWGEEVAIKLIKRGNVDTAQRGEKVRREIEVLKVSLSFSTLSPVVPFSVAPFCRIADLELSYCIDSLWICRLFDIPTLSDCMM